MSAADPAAAREEKPRSGLSGLLLLGGLSGAVVLGLSALTKLAMEIYCDPEYLFPGTHRFEACDFMERSGTHLVVWVPLGLVLAGTLLAIVLGRRWIAAVACVVAFAAGLTAFLAAAVSTG